VTGLLDRFKLKLKNVSATYVVLFDDEEVLFSPKRILEEGSRTEENWKSKIYCSG